MEPVTAAVIAFLIVVAIWLTIYGVGLAIVVYIAKVFVRTFMSDHEKDKEDELHRRIEELRREIYESKK